MEDPFETWRTVPGYEGIYEVSSLGRVKSLARTNSRGSAITERILKTPINSRGYRSVDFVNGGRRTRKVVRVHAVVCEAFHGPRPVGLITRHLDGDQLNNLPGNLSWGTQRQNLADARNHGTMPTAMHPRTPPKRKRLTKGECFRGHQLTDPNIKYTRKGPVCLACQRGHNNVYHFKSRGVVVSIDEAAAKAYSKIMKGTTK